MHKHMLGAFVCLCVAVSSHLLFAAAPAATAKKPDVKTEITAEVLDEYTVTVVVYDKSEKLNGCGTGFIFHGKGGTTYVWTAAHVVAAARAERNKFDGTIEVSKTITGEHDRIVGRTVYESEVLKYSNHPSLKDMSLGEDLAILKLTKKKRLGKSVVFCTAKNFTRGMKVAHMGTMTGWNGGLTFAEGHLGNPHVEYMEKDYHLFVLPALRGSSGGPIIRKDNGHVVAMLTRGRDAVFNLCVPSYRMRAWADKVGAKYAYDASMDFKKGDIEEVYGDGDKTEPEPIKVKPKEEGKYAEFLIRGSGR